MAVLVGSLLTFTVQAVASEQDAPSEPALPYSNARIYRASSEVVWAAAKNIVAEWGLTSTTMAESAQLLVAAWKPFSDFDGSPFFQSVPSLRMEDADLVPLEFQLHLFVSPYVEPVRVHVASVVRTRQEQRQYVHYSLGFVGREFFRVLEQRLGVTGDSIPAPGLHERNPCIAETAIGSPNPGDLDLDGVRRLADIDFLIPAIRSAALVILDATIVFDGTVVAPRVVSVNGPGLANPDVFAGTAESIMSLWRYRPAERDGCPVSVTATVAMSFGIDDGGPWFFSQTLPEREADPRSVSASPAYTLGTDGLQSPRLVSEVTPQYTREAMSELIEGEVWLEAVVLPDGTVGNIQVTRSLDMKFGLDVAAVMAAKQWRFEPGTRDGEPVAVKVPIALDFNLK